MGWFSRKEKKRTYHKAIACKESKHVLPGLDPLRHIAVCPECGSDTAMCVAKGGFEYYEYRAWLSDPEFVRWL